MKFIEITSLTAIEVGIACAVGMGLWVYGLISYLRLKRAVPIIAKAILLANEPNEREEAPVQEPGSPELEVVESADKDG